MCSASSIARLIEATVASMFTTTPFLSPFDGCVPMPMMSMPSSVTSPTIAQIFVVPMSKPTRMSPLFAMITSRAFRASRFALMTPSRALPTVIANPTGEPHRHPVRATAVLEVEHLCALSIGLDGREDALEPRELLRERAVAEADLEPVRPRPERRPVLRVDVDLGHRRAPIEAALGPAVEQRERGLEERLHLGPTLDPVVARDPGDDREIEPVPRQRALEDLAVGVHEVEPREVHERRRAALDHTDLERGRQRPAHLHRRDPWVPAQRRLDEVGVAREQVVAALHRRELEELLRARPREPLEPHLVDSQEIALERVPPREIPAGREDRERDDRRQDERRHARQRSALLGRIPVHPPPVVSPRHRRSRRPDLRPPHRFRALSPEGAACARTRRRQVFGHTGGSDWHSRCSLRSRPAAAIVHGSRYRPGSRVAVNEPDPPAVETWRQAPTLEPATCKSVSPLCSSPAPSRSPAWPARRRAGSRRFRRARRRRPMAPTRWAPATRATSGAIRRTRARP